MLKLQTYKGHPCAEAFNRCQEPGTLRFVGHPLTTHMGDHPGEDQRLEADVAAPEQAG